jgi:hypothetical protein
MKQLCETFAFYKNESNGRSRCSELRLPCLIQYSFRPTARARRAREDRKEEAQIKRRQFKYSGRSLLVLCVVAGGRVAELIVLSVLDLGLVFRRLIFFFLFVYVVDQAEFFTVFIRL